MVADSAKAVEAKCKAPGCCNTALIDHQPCCSMHHCFTGSAVIAGAAVGRLCACWGCDACMRAASSWSPADGRESVQGVCNRAAPKRVAPFPRMPQYGIYCRPCKMEQKNNGGKAPATPAGWAPKKRKAET